MNTLENFTKKQLIHAIVDDNLGVSYHSSLGYNSSDVVKCSLIHRRTMPTETIPTRLMAKTHYALEVIYGEQKKNINETFPYTEGNPRYKDAAKDAAIDRFLELITPKTKEGEIPQLLKR